MTFLMSRDNPRGPKLEEHLLVLVAELQEKTRRVISDSRPQAQMLARNNTEICSLLMKAADLQRQSLNALAELAPDPGPSGPPRVGAGSR